MVSLLVIVWSDALADYVQQFVQAYLFFKSNCQIVSRYTLSPMIYCEMIARELIYNLMLSFTHGNVDPFDFFSLCAK